MRILRGCDAEASCHREKKKNARTPVLRKKCLSGSGLVKGIRRQRRSERRQIVAIREARTCLFTRNAECVYNAIFTSRLQSGCAEIKVHFEANMFLRNVQIYNTS